MSVFNDSWLDDEKALAGADPILRRLAEAGARVRREVADSAEPISRLGELPRPRAVVAAGTEARRKSAGVWPHLAISTQTIGRLPGTAMGWDARSRRSYPNTPRNGTPGLNPIGV